MEWTKTSDGHAVVSLNAEKKTAVLLAERPDGTLKFQSSPSGAVLTRGHAARLMKLLSRFKDTGSIAKKEKPPRPITPEPMRRPGALTELWTLADAVARDYESVRGVVAITSGGGDLDKSIAALRDYLKPRLGPCSLWQLAHDQATYGATAGWWILVTPDGEREVSGNVGTLGYRPPFAARSLAEVWAAANGYEIVPLCIPAARPGPKP